MAIKLEPDIDSIRISDNRETSIYVTANFKQIRISFYKVLYSESTYDEYIEISSGYSETAKNWALLLYKFGFTNIDVSLEDVDTRYTRTKVYKEYPCVCEMSKKRYEQLKKIGKREIRNIREYGGFYGTKLRILKRLSSNKYLVFMIAHSVEICEEDCPYVPKAVDLVVSGVKYFGTSLEEKKKAVRFILKVVQNTMNTTQTELKKLKEALEEIFQINKKKKVSINTSTYSCGHTTISVTVIEPMGQGTKKYSLSFLPVKVAGSSKKAVVVTSVSSSLNVTKNKKSEERRVLSLYKRYLKIKQPKTRIDCVNLVLPLTGLISFFSELTGLPSSQIKKELKIS